MPRAWSFRSIFLVWLLKQRLARTEELEEALEQMLTAEDRENLTRVKRLFPEAKFVWVNSVSTLP